MDSVNQITLENNDGGTCAQVMVEIQQARRMLCRHMPGRITSCCV